jgi:Holliday junction resolvase RusA-like endonuclease
MLVNIRVPIEPPPTHQAALRILKRSNGQMFVGKMAKSSAKRWSTAFELLLQQWKPQQPMEGVLRASINFAYPLLAKHRRTNGGATVVEAKVTRPDCDNLVKSVLDSLTKTGYIKDDANVAILSVYKCFHWKGPFIDVIITEEKNNPFLNDADLTSSPDEQ